MGIIHKRNIDWLKTLIKDCFFIISFIICFIISCGTANGQTVLSGNVLDRSSGKPLPEVICIVSSLDGATLLQYGITNKEGKYSLQLKHEADSLLLQARIMGYKTVAMRIPNRSITRTIYLEDEAFKLKEVVIKPDVITQEGDTINYNVFSFRSAKDTYISDVIKKLPGVEVSESGKISYMGNPINKFYIEGMDLLGGKYSLASNSIPVDAVESVQILENHQSVKALKDVSFTERAAMNLKIKDGKKLRPVGRVSAGAGFDEDEMKYTLDATNLFLKGGKQNLTTLKLNNQGRLLGAELTDHTYAYQLGSLLDPLAYTPVALVNPTLGYTPPEISAFSVFNDSRSFSFNQLFPLKDVSQLRVQASYLDEQTEELQRVRTIYGYSEDNPREIIKEQAARNQIHQANVMLNYTYNADKFYVENRLRTTGEWSEANAKLTGTDCSEQRFDQPYCLVENNLKAIGKLNKDYLTFHSFIRFHRLPQEARLDDALDNTSDSLIVQYRSEELFSTRNELSFNKAVGNSTLSLGTGFKAETNELNSDMRSVPEFLKDSVVNAEWKYRLTEWYVKPSYSFKRNRFAVSVSLPFSGYALKAAEKYGEEHTPNHFSFQPSSHLNWKFHYFWELNASVNYSKHPSEYKQMNNYYYFVNRSTLRHGNQELEVKEALQGRLNLSYRNTLSALFSRLTLGYNRQSSNLLSGYDFIGSQVVRTRVPGSLENTAYTANANVSKIIDKIQTNLNLTTGFTHTDFTQYQDEHVKQLTTNSGYVNLSSNTHLTRWWDWSVMWQSIFSHTRGSETYWMHKLQTDFTFSWNRWLYTMKLDYSSNQVTSTDHKHTAWLSGFLKYKVKKQIQLELAADNLLNSKSYSFRTISGINQIDESYRLRPRQIVLKLSVQY